MVPTPYLDQIRAIRQWADDLLPIAQRVKLNGSLKYAEFRRSVVERVLREVNPDPGLLEIVQGASLETDGKVHVPIKKLDARQSMTLSFLKMALFGADRDVPLEILFSNYTQQLGALVMLNKQLWDSSSLSFGA
jgi:hypothetical protein